MSGIEAKVPVATDEPAADAANQNSSMNHDCGTILLEMLKY